jgi:hypothetical protein
MSCRKAHPVECTDPNLRQDKKYTKMGSCCSTNQGIQHPGLSPQQQQPYSPLEDKNRLHSDNEPSISATRAAPAPTEIIVEKQPEPEKKAPPKVEESVLVITDEKSISSKSFHLGILLLTFLYFRAS